MWPTNLQIHRAVVRQLEARREDETTPGPAAASVTVLTYGAPAAHYFKFKSGGLRQIEDKLSKQPAKLDERQLASSSSTVPGGSAQRLRLKFAVRAALACASQALATAAAAAVQRLESILELHDNESTSPSSWAVVRLHRRRDRRPAVSAAASTAVGRGGACCTR